MKNLQWIDIALFLIIVILLLGLIFSIYHFDKKGLTCLVNPESYALSELKKASGSESLVCSCSGYVFENGNRKPIVHEFGYMNNSSLISK